MCKSFVSLVVVLALLAPAVLVSQEVQKAETPVELHPKFRSPDLALKYVGDAPLTVGNPYDGQTSQTRGANRSYQSYVGNQVNVYFGGGYGRGGILVFDVFGQQYPQNPYQALINTSQHFIMKKVWDSDAKNILPPGTGAASAQLTVASAEANIGRDAGKYGNKTWETSQFVLNVYLAVADEAVQGGGITGYHAAGAIQQTVWWIPNYNVQRGVGIFSGLLSGVNTRKQKRTVQVALFLSIMDIRTRQILWMNDGQGIGEVKADELNYKNILGIESIKKRYPDSYKLAYNAVEAAWK